MATTLRRKLWTGLAAAAVAALLGPVAGPGGPAGAESDPRATSGYWLAAADGGVFAFGGAPFLGSAAGVSSRPVVDIAKTRSGAGYWLAANDGGVFSFGDAPFLGSLPGLPDAPRDVNVVAMASSRLFGDGYYLVTDRGGVYTFGSAPFFGAPASGPVPHPVVDFGLTPTGRGYWVLDAAGNVYAYGDAAPLEGPEVDPGRAPADDRRIALEPWSNQSVHVMSIGGGVFTLASSPNTGFFYGSTPGTGRPMTDLGSCGCSGYYQVDADGTVYPKGDARDLGSVSDALGGRRPAAPIVAILLSGTQPEG